MLYPRVLQACSPLERALFWLSGQSPPAFDASWHQAFLAPSPPGLIHQMIWPVMGSSLRLDTVS